MKEKGKVDSIHLVKLLGFRCTSSTFCDSRRLIKELEDSFLGEFVCCALTTMHLDFATLHTERVRFL